VTQENQRNKVCYKERAGGKAAFSIKKNNEFVYLAHEIKKITELPVVACIRIKNPILANKIIEDGKADMVSMGRALIADPELPKKAFEGRFKEIRPCITCSHCLSATLIVSSFVIRNCVPFIL